MKGPTSKIKSITFKYWTVLQCNKFIGNKLYYFTTDTTAPRFSSQPKIHKPTLPMCPFFDVMTPITESYLIHSKCPESLS